MSLCKVGRFFMLFKVCLLDIFFCGISMNNVESESIWLDDPQATFIRDLDKALERMLKIHAVLNIIFSESVRIQSQYSISVNLKLNDLNIIVFFCLTNILINVSSRQNHWINKLIRNCLEFFKEPL